MYLHIIYICIMHWRFIIYRFCLLFITADNEVVICVSRVFSTIFFLKNIKFSNIKFSVAFESFFFGELSFCKMYRCRSDRKPFPCQTNVDSEVESNSTKYKTEPLSFPTAEIYLCTQFTVSSFRFCIICNKLYIGIVHIHVVLNSANMSYIIMYYTYMYVCVYE